MDIVLDLKKKIVNLIEHIFFYFQKFRCSLKCKLNHYKDLKKRVTCETALGCRNTVLLDNYFFENNLVTSVS